VGCSNNVGEQCGETAKSWHFRSPRFFGVQMTPYAARMRSRPREMVILGTVTTSATASRLAGPEAETKVSAAPAVPDDNIGYEAVQCRRPARVPLPRALPHRGNWARRITGGSAAPPVR